MLQTMFGLASVLLLSTAVLSADDYNKRTVVTINEPVIVAGVKQVTLQPGVYVIKLLNSPSNRNIVLFYNEREDRLMATAMAINNYRLFPTDKTVLKFWETSGANPPALRAWFPPGDHWGQEFVYPRVVALRIATETGNKVLTAPAKTEEELVTAPVTEIESTGKEVPLEEAFVAPPEPELANAEPAPAAPAGEPQPAQPLPATASPIFAIGLLGLMTGLTGVMLRRLS